MIHKCINLADNFNATKMIQATEPLWLCSDLDFTHNNRLHLLFIISYSSYYKFLFKQDAKHMFLIRTEKISIGIFLNFAQNIFSLHFTI